ncbi:aldehyde dehydrogenase (NAD+) [Daejeonella rubra]|uniref:Aldehyde dehydrogenase (NAD+) n=1 Tax=Daejeonella rubra TaxID=990371 RepID=A0A1G9WVX6_9SPHI|nr:aldehyde dehydrogenase family protein [Daejeonella rubra]SDM88326.1 aldehyde dehydrogenase (NAD+) [Daejeonella rubra]
MAEIYQIRRIPSWINGLELFNGDSILNKFNPHTAELDSLIVSSDKEVVKQAIKAAGNVFDSWSTCSPVKRGNILGAFVRLMRDNKDELRDIVARETGKSKANAEGEVFGAIAVGEFFAGEGMRLYARSLTSGMEGKYTHSIRQAIGVCALIVPANTPIANIAWKIFPALICGNTAVLKASEDSPEIAVKMAALAKEAGVPDGVFNVIQGRGDISGKALVEDHGVALISFTGSTSVGKWIAEVAGKRLARVSLELGGKNPFIVCDDADIDNAVNWASLSAFSNAGQRCAAGSRIIVFEQVYDEFVNKLVAKAKSLKLGIDDDCDLGPVINERQFNNILTAIKNAVFQGGKVLCGSNGELGSSVEKGYYIEPTIIEGLSVEADLSKTEIFGPVVSIYKVKGIVEALDVSNNTEYGLTASIHTKNVDRAMWFAQKIRSGLINVNIGTYGSEPHMPFGGVGSSGNGTREPGVEALDVYTELKCISILVREQHI